MFRHQSAIHRESVRLNGHKSNWGTGRPVYKKMSSISNVQLGTYILQLGARGNAVGWGTALQAGKVAGSIPDGVIGIFYWQNPSGRTMALGCTQRLTEISTRNISWG